LPEFALRTTVIFTHVFGVSGHARFSTAFIVGLGLSNSYYRIYLFEFRHWVSAADPGICTGTQGEQVGQWSMTVSTVSAQHDVSH